MTAQDGLLRAIIDAPDDDGLRLMYADRCDEAGGAERAEFIRVQVEAARLEAAGHTADPWFESANRDCPAQLTFPGCEECSSLIKLRRREDELYGTSEAWMLPGLPAAVDGVVIKQSEFDLGAGFVGLLRRGFVEAVACTLADWYGEACRWCRGTGDYEGRRTNGRKPCPNCCAGRVGGHGPAVVRAQPVTVVVTEKRPNHREAPGGRGWYDHRLRGDGSRPIEDELPGEVWDLLEANVDLRNGWKWWPTEADALAALSAALLAWARAATAGG